MSSTPFPQQNLILPAGTEKIGKFEYNVELNASPKMIAHMNDLPISKVNGTIVTVSRRRLRA